MVKQLLYPLHKNSTFCAPEGSQLAGLLVLLGTGFILKNQKKTFYRTLLSHIVIGSIWDIILGAHLPLPLHVAGWVGLSPHLSFHLHQGGDAPHSLAHPYFAGCVAATLVALLIIARVCCCHPCCVTLLLGCVAATLVALLIITRVCRCHPYWLHLQGVLLPPSIYAREHPMSLVPFTAKDCVVCIYYYYV